MFWPLASQSNRIKEKLSSGDFSIEELLQESYDIVMCAANDAVVYNRLKDPILLGKIFEYVLKEPVKRDDVLPDQIPELQRQLALSTTACDTIAQSTHLLEAILHEEKILEIFFKGLKENRSHLVYHRLTTLFLAIFSVDAVKLLSYIKSSQQDFLRTMIQKIGIAPTEDIISLIKQFLRSNNKAPGIIEWMANEQLIRLLLRNLSPHSTDTTVRETITVLQEVTNDILVKSQLSDDHDIGEDFEINFSSSDDEKKPKTPPAIMVLYSQYEEPETLDLLFTNLFSSSICHIYTLPFVMNIISQSVFPTLLEKSLQYIDQFLSVLKPSKHDQISTNSHPSANGTTGFGRLITLRFLIMLLKLDTSHITSLLVEKCSFPIILDLYFIHPYNTVMHNLILEYFSIGLTRKQYIFLIISSSNLIPRMVGAWENLVQANESRLKDQALYDHAYSWLKKLFRNFKNCEQNFPVDVAVRVQIIRGSHGWGCFGHLFKLSNQLVSIYTQTSPEFLQVSHRDMWSKFYEDEGWKKFVEEVLKVYNTISSQKLDQNSSSDSQDSSDDNNND